MEEAKGVKGGENGIFTRYDIGSSSIKASLLATEGQLVASATSPDRVGHHSQTTGVGGTRTKYLVGTC